ncbi:MAG TPA: S24 family peptidase [Synergistales bacterium]|nr:protein SamA [Synergistaceae bacterium]HPA58780.1 S24 family peptidase [Synergistales bacterium]HQQ10072.1 S24 family peptidase [Synergistales bacterium]
MNSRSTTGFPSPADPFREDPLDINSLLVRNRPSTFLMRSAGSIPGWSIKEGDILVVDRSCVAREGDLAVIARDSELALREVDSGQIPVWGVVRGVVRVLRRG